MKGFAGGCRAKVSRSMRVGLKWKPFRFGFFFLISSSAPVYTQTSQKKKFYFREGIRLLLYDDSVSLFPYSPYGMSACVCSERMWRMNGAARLQQLGHHPTLLETKQRRGQKEKKRVVSGISHMCYPTHTPHSRANAVATNMQFQRY